MIKCNKNHRRAISCEPLEGRRMFVTYQVAGTSGPDAISISIDEANNKIISAVNGVSASASDLVNNNIQIDGLGGNDTITIVETGLNTVVVNAGIGNDTVNLGLGNHDLDDIRSAVTVTGDGGTDTMILFDESDTTADSHYSLFNGNGYGRDGAMATVTGNVEEVVLNMRTSQTSNVVVNDRPTAHVTINSNHAGGQALVLSDNDDSLTFRPSDTSAVNAGLIYSTTSVDLINFAAARFQSLGQLTLTTPNATDSLTMSIFEGVPRPRGTSSGVAMMPMDFLGGIDTFRLDMEANDAGGGNDSMRFNTGPSDLAQLDVLAGTGSNSLRIFGGGTWRINPQLGAAGGTNLSVTLADGADVTFPGTQQLNILSINLGATARFDGAAVLGSLAVSSGTAAIETVGTSTTTVTATSGLFVISSTTSLVKKGSGTLNINVPQSIGSSATFENRLGTTNFNTDCGSSTARPLNVFAKSGTINFGASQHVNSVHAEGGYISMATNGNRVLVTNSIVIGSEGIAVNLNDNDMIVDYANAAEAANVRAMIASGYSNGSWNGIGINSKTAELNPTGNTGLGSLEGTQWIDTYGATVKFDGQPVDSTCMLIKYTYYGDVDFNGSVDASDYNLIDFGFVNHLSTWAFGDVDGNGSVDASDYNLIDFAFTTQTAVL